MAPTKKPKQDAASYYENEYRRYWDRHYQDAYNEKHGIKKYVGKPEVIQPPRSRRWWVINAISTAAIASHLVREEAVAIKNLKKAIESGARELRFHLGSVQWEFIRIFPGEFLMGSVAGDPDADNDGLNPARKVRLTRPFYISTFQVTNAQYVSIMLRRRESKFPGDDFPVHDLHYREALDFCRRMSSTLGIAAALPTEAQWEYACRAGTNTIYSDGNSVSDLDRIAWFVGNSAGRLHPVGRRQPNAWGLYDMEGNLYEPCLDYISMSSAEMPSDDPVGSRSPERGVARGGAFLTLARACRCSARILTNDSFGSIGLRVVINPP